MFDGYHHMWGMHWAWWIFWILLIILAAWLFSRQRAGQPPTTPQETPLETLQRRYAAGEISTEEYEERKALLVRDSI